MKSQNNCTCFYIVAKGILDGFGYSLLLPTSSQRKYRNIEKFDKSKSLAIASIIGIYHA